MFARSTAAFLMVLVTAVSAFAQRPPPRRSSPPAGYPPPPAYPPPSQQPVYYEPRAAAPEHLSTDDFDLYFELLGRAGIYGIGFDVPVHRRFSVGLVGSYFSLSDEISATISVLILAPYANFYTGGRNHRGYLTAGLDVGFASASLNTSSTGLFGSSSTSASSTAVIPHVGGGYEYRADGGFLFRLAAYGLFVPGVGIAIWPGLTLGAAF